MTKGKVKVIEVYFSNKIQTFDNCKVYRSEDLGIFVLSKEGVIYKMHSMKGVMIGCVNAPKGDPSHNWSSSYLRVFKHFGLVTKKELSDRIKVEAKETKQRVYKSNLEYLERAMKEFGLKLTKEQKASLKIKGDKK